MLRLLPLLHVPYYFISTAEGEASAVEEESTSPRITTLSPSQFPPLRQTMVREREGKSGERVSSFFDFSFLFSYLFILK